MTAAVSQLRPFPDYLLLDAIEIDLPIEQKALIHGDARSVSIAAASILAKVERDRQMETLARIHQRYSDRVNRNQARIKFVQNAFKQISSTDENIAPVIKEASQQLAQFSDGFALLVDNTRTIGALASDMASSAERIVGDSKMLKDDLAAA